VYVPQSPTPAATLDRDELIAELRARIEDLRTDRDAWRDQARRSDYMASTALERTRELESRLRELEAPADEATSEARESPETVEEEHDRAESRPDAPGSQEGVQRPWWRTVFGRGR
jgi:chromosome segregation ATPase